MKSIWFFVGLILAVMGGLITISAIYSLIWPPAWPKILSHLHADLWWGFFMLAFGVVFALINRRNVSY